MVKCNGSVQVDCSTVLAKPFATSDPYSVTCKMAKQEDAILSPTKLAPKSIVQLKELLRDDIKVKVAGTLIARN